MGSTLAARRAGMQEASKATAMRMSEAAMKVTGIGGLNTVEQTRKESRQLQRSGNAYCQGDQRQLQPLPNHHPQHVALLRPQRHANANFVGSPAHGISDYSIHEFAVPGR